MSKLFSAYQLAAKRVEELACKRARESETLSAQSQLDCPAIDTCAYAGNAVASSARLYPSAPYTPFQLPIVVASVPTKLTLPLPPVAGGGVPVDDAVTVTVTVF